MFKGYCFDRVIDNSTIELEGWVVFFSPFCFQHLKGFEQKSLFALSKEPEVILSAHDPFVCRQDGCLVLFCLSLKQHKTFLELEVVWIVSVMFLLSCFGLFVWFSGDF